MTEPLLVSPRLSFVERVIQIPDVELFDLSSDGQTALVLSNRTGSYQLALVPTSGGPLRAVSHGNDRVTWARISNDSTPVLHGTTSPRSRRETAHTAIPNKGLPFQLVTHRRDHRLHGSNRRGQRGLAPRPRDRKNEPDLQPQALGLRSSVEPG